MSIQSIAELSSVVTTKFQLKFAEILNSSKDLGTVLTQEVTTNTLEARVPFINRWVGLTKQDPYATVNYETIEGQYITLQAKKLAKGLQVGRFDWTEPVAQSLLMNQVDTLAASAAVSRTERICEVLNLGDTSAFPAPYGGGNVFSTSHTLNGQTVSNLLVNNPLTSAGFDAARNVLRSLPLGPNGQYLPTELGKLHLIHPPNLEAAARNLLRSETLYESNIVASNPYLNAAEEHVSSFLTDPNDWFLVLEFPGLVPFATVQNKDSSPSLIARIAETDPNVIENNLYLWNLQLIEETNVVHWYLMVKSTNANS